MFRKRQKGKRKKKPRGQFSRYDLLVFLGCSHHDLYRAVKRAKMDIAGSRPLSEAEVRLILQTYYRTAGEKAIHQAEKWLLGRDDVRRVKAKGVAEPQHHG